MKRSIFLTGSIILVVGFVLYQFGFSYELHQTTLLGKWLAQITKPAIQNGISLEAIAIILQFTGGLLAAFGLITCFAGVARSTDAQPKRDLVKSLDIEPKETVSCRFCGSRIEEGSSFCPKCNKSQT